MVTIYKHLYFGLFILLLVSLVQATDTTAPSTAFSYTTDWELKDLSYSFSCTDSESGCQMIYYRYDTDPSINKSFTSWTEGAPKILYNSPISSNLNYYKSLSSLKSWVDFNSTATVNGLTVIPNSNKDYNLFRADNNTTASYPTVNSSSFTFDGTNDYITGLMPIYGYDSKFDNNGYYWPFDGGTDLNARDRWQYLRLNATGSVTYPAGKIGNALNVTTASSYLSVSAPSGVKVGKKSVALWLRPDNNALVNNTVFSLDSNNYQFGFDSSRRWFFTFIDSSSNVQTAYSSASLVDFNVWQHLIFIMDINDSNTMQVNLKIYKNGALLSSTDFTTGVSSTYGSTMYFGSATNSTTGKYSGKIDELKFYPIVLDANKIDLVYRRNNYYYAQRMHLDFEDCNLTTAKNSFGSSDANLSTVDSSVNPTCTNAAAKTGFYSLDLNNLKSRVEMPIFTGFDVNSGGTVSFWIYPKVLTANSYIFVHNQNNNRVYAGTSLSNASDVAFVFTNPAITVNCSNALTQSRWTHIAMTWEDYNTTSFLYKGYVNGSLCASVYSTKINLFGQNTANDVIGDPKFSTSGQALNSYLDDFRIYSANLDSNTIYDLYSKELSVIYMKNNTDYYENYTSTYDKLQRPGLFSGDINYIAYINEDINKSSYYLDLNSDGNYTVEYYSVDKSANTETTKSSDTYISSPAISYLTYDSDMNIRSNFSKNSHINVLLYLDNNYLAPIVNLIDPSGNTFATNQSIYYDANKFIVSFDLNSDVNEGYFDLNIFGHLIKRVFYVSNIWTNKYLAPDGNIFYYSLDFNLTNPISVDRYNSYFESDFNFIYNANPNSVRVLEYVDGNLIEIPYSIYDINANLYLNSAKIGFLTSIKSQGTNRFALIYSTYDINKSYQSDLNDSTAPNRIQNDYFSADFDLNRGHVAYLVQKLQKDYNISYNTFPYIVTTYDYSEFPVVSDYNNLGLGLMIRPYVTSATHSNNVIANVLQSYNVTVDLNTPFKKKYNYQVTTQYYDYNYTYTFYSKSKYFEVDFNYRHKVNDILNSEYDAGARVTSNYFATSFYKKQSNPNIVSTSFGYTADGNDFTGISDAQYAGYYGQSYKTGFGIIFGDYNYYGLDDIVRFLESYSGLYYHTISLKLYGNLTVDGDQDIYSSRNYYSVFNGFTGSEDLNNIYVELENPLLISYAPSYGVYDTVNPAILDINYSPIGTLYDVNTIYCNALVSDNVWVNKVNFNVVGPNTNIDQNVNVDSNNTVVSYDFNLGSGDYNCFVTVYDYALNRSDTNYISFNITDTTAPQIYNISLNPDSNQAIDPNTNVDFNIYLNEYSGNSIDANIIYRYSVDQSIWSDWNSNAMSCSSISDYNYLCQYSLITLPGELYYEYKIYSKDSSLFDANSQTYKLYSLYERTWTSNNTNSVNCISSICSGIVDTNVYISDINIQNTGDLNLSFRLTSDWSPKSEIFYNDNSEGSSGYDVTVTPNNSANILLKVKTKVSSREDDLNVKISSLTDNSAPVDSNIAFKVVSYNSGPYIYPNAIYKDDSVKNGDINVVYGIRLTNIGNENCNNAFYEWSLPNGFSLISGDRNHYGISLDTSSNIDYNIKVNILDSVTSGSNNINLYTGCLDPEDGNRSISIGIAVSKETSTTTTIRGGGGGGGGSARDSSGGNSVEVQKQLLKSQKLFETKDYISIVRGKDSNFSIKIESPFNDSNIVNVAVSIDGIFSKYIRLSDYNIPLILPNQIYYIDANILAPSYFESGVNNITFRIDGEVQGVETDGNKVYTTFSEQRLVFLKIYDVSLDDVNKLYSDALSSIEYLKSLGFYTQKLEKMLEIAKNAIDREDFKSAMNISSSIILTKDDAIQISSKIADLNQKINDAKSRGINANDTQRILLLVASRIDRGDYEGAKQLLSNADLTYALEIKGEYSLAYILKQNWPYVILSFILLTAAIISLIIYIRMLSLKSALSKLSDEELIITDLIKDIQKRCFVQNKMSVDEYKASLSQYEARIDQIVTESIQIKNRLHFILNKEKALKFEKAELVDKLKELQRMYFNDQRIAPGVYNVTFKSVIRRIGDIEGELADIDLKNALKKRNSLFDRISDLFD